MVFTFLKVLIFKDFMCQVFHDKVKCAHTMSFLCIPTAISEVQVTNIPCLGYYNSLVAQNDTVSPNNKNSQYILSVHYVQSTLTTALYHYLIKPPNNLKVLIISLFYRWRKKLRKVKLLSDITELESGTPRIPAQADRLQSLTLFLCLNSLMFPKGQS